MENVLVDISISCLRSQGINHASVLRILPIMLNKPTSLVRNEIQVSGTILSLMRI